MAPSPQSEAVEATVKRLDHPTADEVFQEVRAAFPRVSLATVYRNLDAMVRNGRARVRQIGNQRRYDGLVQPHAHLHCTQCDRLIDVELPDDPVPRVLEAADGHGFLIVDQTLEMMGVCEDCRSHTGADASGGP